MGTLYIVAAAADDPEDMTLRALRILDEAALIVADSSADTTDAGRLLAHHGIATPLTIPLDSGLSSNIAHILETLRAGDVAFLVGGLLPAPTALGHHLVGASRDHGFPIESVPGASPPVTALVLSGLPAGTFRYLGELPQQALACRALLSSVSAERRTLVLLVPSGRLPETLPHLASCLGERSLSLMWVAGGDPGDIWRGTVGGIPEEQVRRLDPAPAILVVGGAREQVARWDEPRLCDEIWVRRKQGLGAKETSQQLAGESGWSRREIYRLVVEISQFPQDE